MTDAIFDRTERLLGRAAMERITASKVILFGIGGVGSWCAESLARSGIGSITIVDADSVNASNINRQIMATTRTVGMAKVDALRARLLEINPHAEVTAIQEVYSAANATQFDLSRYDYVIDAIDSLSHKMELIVNATKKNDGAASTRLFSSMGAALKLDPSQVRVSEFWEVDGCPLAAALRRKMRHTQRYPGRKFKCVWSPEVLPNRGETATDEPADNPEYHKTQVNGSIAHITAIMGFTLAGLVIQDIVKNLSST